MPASASATILVVDEEPRILRVVHLILKREGYRVLAARTAAEAALVCSQHGHPVDLVLADARTLESVDLCPAARMVLQKPFTPEALAKSVRGLLG